MFSAFRPQTLRDEFRSVIEKIEKGEPINPRHAQPASVDQEGFASCIGDEDRAAFAKTANAGMIINRHLNWGGWRVQERNDPLLKISDSPMFGRSFNVFYNALLVGELYIYASPYLTKDPAALAVEIEVEHAQLFPFSILRSLLRTLAILAADSEATDLAQRELEVDRCLVATLWEVVRTPEMLQTISFHTIGPASRLIAAVPGSSA
jgi:hypothetical protein